MPQVSDIFGVINSVITAFGSTLSTAFNAVTALFWTPGSGSDAGSFTFLGILVLIGVGVGLIYLGYRVIKGLMHRV